MCHAQKADEAAVAVLDNFFEQVYRYTVRKALDVSLAAAASARVEDHRDTAGLAQLFFTVSPEMAWLSSIEQPRRMLPSSGLHN